MKQIISVRGIIKKNGAVLLLKRARGRDSILGQYELPGGKVQYHRQPKETLIEYVAGYTGLKVQTMRLIDVCTYIDTEERNAQYIFILYELYCENNNKITLSEKYSEYRWMAQSEASGYDLTESTEILLEVGLFGLDKDDQNVVNLSTDKSYIYTDGGSRGNPGPSAAGYVIVDEKDNIITQGNKYLGEMTNDRAEYYGLLYALQAAQDKGLQNIEVRSDSLLVVNQMNGTYTIRDSGTIDLYEQAVALASKFARVRFVHVSRDLNTLADGLVNKSLDEKTSK